MRAAENMEEEQPHALMMRHKRVQPLRKPHEDPIKAEKSNYRKSSSLIVGNCLLRLPAVRPVAVLFTIAEEPDLPSGSSSDA